MAVHESANGRKCSKKAWANVKRLLPQVVVRERILVSPPFLLTICNLHSPLPVTTSGHHTLLQT